MKADYLAPAVEVMAFALEKGFAGSDLNYKTNVVTGSDPNDKMEIKDAWDGSGAPLNGDKFWSN